MTKDTFLASLVWQEGSPPYPEEGDMHDEYESQPLICENVDRTIFVVGDCNFQTGVCNCCTDYDYRREKVVRYAYLWDKEEPTP